MAVAAKASAGPMLVGAGWLRTVEVAERLGVTAARVRQMYAEGVLPAAWTPYGRLVAERDVDALKARRRPRIEAAGAA